MTNKGTEIAIWILGIGIISVIVIMLIVGSIQIDERKKEVASLVYDSDFSIGKVTANYYSNGGGNVQYLTSFGFQFGYKNILFKCNQGKTETELISPEISDEHFNGLGHPLNVGCKFLVLVNKKDPNKSVLCLDKPMVDSSEYRLYIKEFEKKRRK
jgi:hypothetical protein